MRAFGQMRHEQQPWLCAVEHMVTLKLLHSRQHCPLACVCRATADAISQDQQYLTHRDFCKRILPAIPPIIDVETTNEIDARCHHLFRVTNALENHRCIACGHDRPVLEPFAIASSLSICPSCDEALQQGKSDVQLPTVRGPHCAGNSSFAYVPVVELDCKEEAQ